MFGDYFKNLTTNQKIMFGVAVFLVICVIVYLIYKYVFKAAKNFIQHYIMPTREKFEKVRLNLKTRCKRDQFFNGSNCVDISNHPRTVIASPTVPPLSSTQVKDRDYLRWVLSYKGSFIKIDTNNPDVIDNYTEQNPTNGNVVIRNNSIQQLSSAIIEKTETDVELASGVTFRTANIVISGLIPQLQTPTSYDKAYKNLSDALSLCCRLNNDIPDVEKVTLDPSGNLPTSTTHKVYYNFSRTVPSSGSQDDRLTGNFTYFIPIRTINFLTPVNNVPPATLENMVNIDIFAATAYSEYSNALTNCREYISKFVSVNKNYLKACVATILKSCGLYKSNSDISNVTDPNFNNETQPLENAIYNVVLNNGVYYIRVSNSPFNCGDGREVIPTFSTPQNPSDPSCIRTDTIQYNDRFTATNNISSDGIFVDVCRTNLPGGTTYNVVRGIGSCVGEPCSLTNANTPVKGILNAFVVQDVDNLQKTFISGQSVILPPNLVTLGTKANTPSWYQFVNQYEITVLKDATNSSFEQCTNPSRLQAAIKTSDPSYTYESTDEITYIRGSTVYVTKRKKAQYRVNEPLRWGIYYSDDSGMNISPVAIASIDRLSARNTTGFYFIGAPLAENSPFSGIQAVPVFIQKAQATAAGISGLTGAPVYDAERKQRSQSLEVMRNIWIGLDRADVMEGSNFRSLSSFPTISFGRLLSVFFYLITGVFFNDVEAYDFLTTGSPPTPVSVLNWGIAISSNLPSGSTLGINSFSYANFYGNYQPSTSSAQFNTRSISFDNNLMYFLDVPANQLSLINNSYSASPSRSTLSVTNPILFKSFPTNVGGVVITSNGIAHVSGSVSSLSQTSVNNPAPGTPPITDIDTKNLNVIMVGYNPDTATNCILYGTIVSNQLTLKNVTISNLSNFPNDLFAFSSVKFCNRSSTSGDINIILTTRFAQSGTGSNLKKSGYLYRGTITAVAGSEPTITLTKLDQTNYDIRSVACSDDATISSTPQYISIATYRGPVISYKLSGNTYNEQSISGIGRWISVYMTPNGQYQAACSEVQSSEPLANDGRIVYADNFALKNDDWRIIPNPKKYIGSPNSSTPNREDAPQFDPTDSRFNPLFNSYNFNKIELATNAGKVYIYSTFSRTFSEVSPLAPGNGLLRIELQ